MNLQKIGFLFLMCCLSLVACKEDEVVLPGDNPMAYEIPVKEIFAAVSGTVSNESGQVLENATVQIGSNTTVTDENGAFIFKNIKMNEYGTLIKINKPGFFTGIKMIQPRSGKRSNTQVRLLSKEIVGTVASASGGSVNTNGNGKITLPANGIVTSSGSAYTGDVKVAAKWIDPTSDVLGETMPGDLRAINTNQEAVQLATYGMLAVELEGASGELLNLAEGSTAALEFPVPAELQASAPATIPLWYFDETTGYWVEEGSATFDGTKYVGEVAHFSFWNCDAPFPVIEVEGLVTDPDGNPLSDINVYIKINSTANIGYGRTNEDGIYSGKIPKDEELTISIAFPGQCNAPVYSEVIGPFSSDVILPTIVVDLSTITFGSYLNFSGTMEDCDGNDIVDGYLKVYFNGQQTILWPDDSGLIEGLIFHCDPITTVDLEGYDFIGEKKSDITNFSVSGTDFDFGTLVVCEALVEFLNYNIDGIDYTFVDPFSGIDVDVMIIEGQGLDSTYVRIILGGNTPGTYNPSSANFSGAASNNFPYAYCQGPTGGCMDFEVTLTTVGAVGEFIEGSFNGTMDGSDPSGTSTVTGDFRAIREY